MRVQRGWPVAPDSLSPGVALREESSFRPLVRQHRDPTPSGVGDLKVALMPLESEGFDPFPFSNSKHPLFFAPLNTLNALELCASCCRATRCVLSKRQIGGVGTTDWGLRTTDWGRWDDRLGALERQIEGRRTLGRQIGGCSRLKDRLKVKIGLVSASFPHPDFSRRQIEGWSHAEGRVERRNCR